MTGGKELPLGGVILDSLTLQSTLRILGENDAVQAPLASRYRRRKWDYNLNFALRVAIDVECLAQLVHAIVMHEEIGISPGFVHQGVDKVIMRSGYGRSVPRAAGEGLGDVVTLLAFPERLHRQILLMAGERAIEISRTPEFRRYLEALSSGGLEGVILDISNGYFDTGYSDPSTLASFELQEENDQEAIYYDLALDEMKQGHMAIGQRFRRLAQGMRSIDYEDHALVKMPFGHGAEKRAAAYDVVRNTAAALYYQYLAQLVNAPYLPHALREPLATFDPDGASPADIEGRVVAHLQALRRHRAEAITAMIGGSGFDLQVPLVLAKVLQDAREPAEVIPRALELRETASARRLRAWFRDLHAQLQTPGADMRSAERELDGFRNLVRRWADSTDADDGGSTITMGVNLGVVSFSSPLPKGLNRIRRRWRLQFLYDLARAGDATPRLGPRLANVLGEPIAEAWQQAQRTIERFTPMGGSPGRPESVLDLR